MSRDLVPYVPVYLRTFASYVLSFFTCLTCLNVFTSLACLQSFTYLMRPRFLQNLCTLMFTCFNCPHFLVALNAFVLLRAFTFLRALPVVTLCARIFYVPYVPSFLRPYILFMHMLIKSWHKWTSELTYDYSPLLLLNSAIYQLLSSILTSIKLLSYSARFFSFFEKKNIDFF